MNDILNLKIDPLNEVLTDNLLNRLLVPLYVDSLTRQRAYGQAVSVITVNVADSVFLEACLSRPTFSNFITVFGFDMRNPLK